MKKKSQKKDNADDKGETKERETAKKEKYSILI